MNSSVIFINKMYNICEENFINLQCGPVEDVCGCKGSSNTPTVIYIFSLKCEGNCVCVEKKP